MRTSSMISRRALSHRYNFFVLLRNLQSMGGLAVDDTINFPPNSLHRAKGVSSRDFLWDCKIETRVEDKIDFYRKTKKDRAYIRVLAFQKEKTSLSDTNWDYVFFNLRLYCFDRELRTALMFRVQPIVQRVSLAPIVDPSVWLMLYAETLLREIQ